jgi:hypothetical protein
MEIEWFVFFAEKPMTSACSYCFVHSSETGAIKSSLEDFMKAVREAKLDTHVHYLNHGDTYTFDVEGAQAEAV